jgi:hypothetical protein
VSATHLLYRSCFGFYFPALVALHASRGYIVCWLSSADPISKASKTFSQLAASIEFHSRPVSRLRISAQVKSGCWA